MTLRYGSVCSGIEAATAAWHHMGWEAAFFSEIEKFPRAVLEHHYPDVPLHGDFTTIKENEYGKIDLLVGGTPCQSFSVAGLRGGLDDDRGNLALEFCRLAQREQPRWIVWENVPGVLSSNGGRDFGSILGALEDLGYGLAYRVLDAQYFGVAQRRRRVFVVGYLGDWRPAAAVLFERHSMSGHPAPSREKRQEAAAEAATGTGGSGGDGRRRVTVATHDVVGTLCAEDSPHGARGLTGLQTMLSGYIQPVVDTFERGNERERPDLAGPLTAGMHKGPRGTEAVESGHVVTVGTLRAHHPGTAGTQSDTDHIVAIDAAHAFKVRGGCEGGGKGYLGSDEVAFTLSTHQDQHIFSEGAAFPINTQLGLRGPDVSNTSRDGLGLGGENDPAYTLQAGHSHAVAYAIQDVRGLDKKQNGKGWSDEGVSYTVDTHATQGVAQAVVPTSTVRRLTPTECERLQGFPDNFTAIPWRKKGAEDCPDGPRYKALGNSMAVPVMRWIGERIQLVDDYISII